MLDELRAALSVKGAEFIEARAASVWTNDVLIRDNEVERVKSGNSTAYGVRVLVKGSWGFAAGNDMNRMRDIAEAAVKLAKAGGRDALKTELAEAEAKQDRIKTKVRKHPLDVALEDKVKALKELAGYGRISKKILTVDAQYIDAYGVNAYVNSEGAAIQQEPVNAFLLFSAYSKGEELFRANDRVAGHYGVEVLEGKEGFVENVSKNALLLLKSKLPPKGEMPVVIDPKMAGVFAHEAIGHACEADSVINQRSILEKKIGMQVGSEHVTIIDDATIPKFFGSYHYDAEGVPAQKKILVEKGVLKQFLHNRETAKRLGTRSTGNARSQSPTEFPLVRMSNTFFDKGDRSIEELLEGMGRGVFVSGMKGGVTEPNTGYFQFAAEYGHLIENGEKTAPLRDITLVGNIVKTLKNVEALGKEWSGGHPGFCGKAGQSVPVSDGGPHIRIGKVLVGG
ncbi:MAG: TldD/PmbA family protein [Candidatus Diapherotrites archaeon]|nr:TldD/PmbA family protein [Candidatus Diapherotrites archaeon]